jgi:hypothetical protein
MRDSTTADKTRARQAACLLIDDGNFGDRGGFYSYYDGQVMMALSVYAQTGGPDIPGESFRRVQLLRPQRPRHHGQGGGPLHCRPDPGHVLP